MAEENWTQAEPGVRRKVLQPGSKLLMMLVAFESGARGTEHAHPHEQMTFCVEGRFRFTIEGEEHVLEAGENLVIPPNAMHGTIALTDGKLLDCFTPIREDLLGEYRKD